MNKPTDAGTPALQHIEHTLGHYSLASDNLGEVIEGIRDVLATDKAFLYSLAPRDDDGDLAITRYHASAPSPGRWREIFGEYLQGRGVEWGAYNALSPEPAQRDRVLRGSEIAHLNGGATDVVESELYARLGASGEDTMRVLVCEGPSMLAWVGIIQPDPTTEEQRELLQALVPALRKRLGFERLFGRTVAAEAALGLALEEVPGAAWVISQRGRIEHANAAGRARLDADRKGLGALLRSTALGETVERGPRDPRFKMAHVRDAAGEVAHILVEMATAPSSAIGIEDSARRLALTPAQTRVFEQLARGASNATIAANLGVAERTVEAHVTAILVKAQVPNRATLIVQIFEGPRRS